MQKNVTFKTVCNVDTAYFTELKQQSHKCAIIYKDFNFMAMCCKSYIIFLILAV